MCNWVWRVRLHHRQNVTLVAPLILSFRLNHVWKTLPQNSQFVVSFVCLTTWFGLRGVSGLLVLSYHFFVSRALTLAVAFVAGFNSCLQIGRVVHLDNSICAGEPRILSWGNVLYVQQVQIKVWSSLFVASNSFSALLTVLSLRLLDCEYFGLLVTGTKSLDCYGKVLEDLNCVLCAFVQVQLLWYAMECTVVF